MCSTCVPIQVKERANRTSAETGVGSVWLYPNAMVGLSDEAS